MPKNTLGLPFGRAICYSGYRQGQDPRQGLYPSEDQILEDLRILEGTWSYLRLYDPGQHAEMVLRIIAREELNFQVLLGVDLAAEVSNPDCPWGADFSAETLAENHRKNQKQVDQLLRLVKRYGDHIFAVSIGNEASVDWTDHRVPVERLIEIACNMRDGCDKPVTFCENYVPWLGKLDPLVPYLDFLSVHTYPVWEYFSVDNAMAYSEDNYQQVAERHPDKPVIITEGGWPTRANGRGIDPWNASESLQQTYLPQLDAWSSKNQILTFVFEAFDEPWKGSPEADEPEKHWGIYREDRSAKPVVSCYEEGKASHDGKAHEESENPEPFTQAAKPLFT